MILILIAVSGKRTLRVSGLLWSLSLDSTNSVSGCVITCVTILTMLLTIHRGGCDLFLNININYYTSSEGGAGIAQWLEHRTRD